MQTSLNVKKDPFVLLLFTTILLLFAFALSPVAHVEFQDKVMFTIPLGNMVWTIPLYLICFWLVYLITKKYLYSVTVTWIHVLTTVITNLSIVTVLYIGITPSSISNDRYEIIGNAMQALTLILVFAQFIYLANVGLGILRRLKTK